MMWTTGVGRVDTARRDVASAAYGLGLAAAGLGAGVALGLLGDHAGAWVMIAVPAAVLWFAVVLSRPVWAIALFFLSLPIGLNVVGSVKLVDVATVSVVGAVVIAALLRRTLSGFTSPALGWGLALCASTLLAVPGAIDVGVASARVVTVISGFALAAAIVAATRSFADLRLLIALFLGVGAIMGVVALTDVSQFQAVAGGLLVKNRATGVFTDPNELGSFSVLLLMASIGVTLARIDVRLRLLAGAVGGLALGALIVSLSRGAWIGTGFGLVALAILLPQARRRLLAALAAAMLVGAAIGAFVPSSPTVRVVEQRFGTITTGADRSSRFYDSRPQIWAEAFREIGLHPWFGVGPANFPLSSAKQGSKSREVGASHAHDVVLTVAVEAGLPAAFFLVGLTVAIGLAARRATRRMRGTADAAITAGVAAALFGEAGHGIIDNTLLNPVILGMLWAFVGILLAADRLSRGSSGVAVPADQPTSRRVARRNGRVATRPTRTTGELESSR